MGGNFELRNVLNLFIEQIFIEKINHKYVDFSGRHGTAEVNRCVQLDRSRFSDIANSG